VLGDPVTEPITAGLLRDDGLRVYIVRDDIPVLFPEESLVVDDLALA